MKYKTGSSTKHRILVHLVWCPKYRRRVLRGKIVIRLKKLFREACEINDWGLEELGIEIDHVHMLIQISPKDAIAKVVQTLKGGSSRIIRLEFPKLKEFLWGDSLLEDGYFAESVGLKNEKIIREYIKTKEKFSKLCCFLIKRPRLLIGFQYLYIL
jgi:putative transposase